MTSNAAARLIALVATPEQVESILGDLDEERATVAARAGERAAHVWFRRQTLRSVPHLMIGQLRAAPVRTIACALGAFFVIEVMFGAIELPIRFLVSHYHLHRYVNPAPVWTLVRIAEGYAVPVLAGFVAARFARERAVTAILLLWLVVSFLVLLQTPWHTLITILPQFVLGYLRVTSLMIAGAVAGRAMNQRRRMLV